MQNFVENKPESSILPPTHSNITVEHTLQKMTAYDAWTVFCEKLKILMSADEFSQWFKPLKAKSINAKEMIISIPNMIYYQSILDNFWGKIEQAKTLLHIEDLVFRFEIDEAQGPQGFVEPDREQLNQEFSEDYLSEQERQIANEEAAFTNQKPVTSNAISRALSTKSSLNPAYNFETFVRGDSNQFAHATCSAVAENPGKTYNPLFIYGSTGLGKTHLLHAVGAKVLSHTPEANVTYISSERFMNEMIYCLRFNKMWEFRKKYRSCDVFLVDDIQFISGKERTQEEFFHTFNTLYESKKQIVITSDLFPQDIPDIEDRLRNRFQWGLIADIQAPSIEHRVAILMNKAALLRIHLDEDVAMYIANHAKRNIRELEGALHRIAAFAALHGRVISLDLAAETFQNVLGEAPKRLTIEMIQKTVADHFKIRLTDMKSKRRQRALTIPRQIAMYLARNRTSASFPEIGEKFGGKDHTTVLHAVRKIDGERSKDLDLKTSIEALERKLEQIC